ncbi:NAD(P)H-dependent oxidoreductase [Fretibacter rubidus]|uniref:NAD(P)H-dependent oxidoreductase n=1 Tax=Fretibacter rubidus TaxID=570162 RepID=UPI00352AE0A4
MVSKIFTWVGHPRESSLSLAMADAYDAAAAQAGATVRRMTLSDMDFDVDLREGYHSRKTLEPCLEQWRENVLWADHLCWVYPVWWGGMPAKMKGVIDRAVLPGFAMSYPEGKIFWERLLVGRSADVILTSDAPPWFDQIVNGRPAKNQAVNTILKFAGIKPVKTLQVGTVKTASDAKIQKWIEAAGKRGRAAARR